MISRSHTVLASLALAGSLLFMACDAVRRGGVRERFVDRELPTATGDPEGQWFAPEKVVMEDMEYASNIKSVRLLQPEIAFSLPVLELGSTQQLSLLFDDLEGVHREYRYTVVHCDPLWNPSPLMKTEYIDGFHEGFVDGYAFSKATRQPYVHYFTLLPAPEMRLTRSGNYVLLVYPAGRPEEVIISRRFMVYESRVTVNARARRPSVVEMMRIRQEIDFEIDRGSYPIDNPFLDLMVIVQQNGRWDNLKVGVQPRMVMGNTVSYRWENVVVFDGSNEFRHIDLRTLSRYTPRMAMILREDGLNHVFVRPDYKRAFQVYVEDTDINGDYVISSDEAMTDHHTEADYAWVHFYMPSQRPFSRGGVYIFGALTNWQLQPDYRMEYNEATETYEIALYLKQGFYNYKYVLLENAESTAITSLTEGNHYAAENVYTIYVYHRQPGDMYHRLIAIERVIAPQQL
jgi:hypothetical protein